MHDVVVWASLQLALAALLLFVAGHRLPRGHWTLSIATITGVAAAAWAVQRGLVGATPPLGLALVLGAGGGAVVTLVFAHWNAAGCAAFTAALAATATFLLYAAQVVGAAQLDRVSLAAALLLLGLQVGALILLLAHTFEIVDVVCRTRWRNIGDRKTVRGYAPKVSLHVPTHNEPPELVIETLNALARLAYPNFEVIVVDNNTAEEHVWRPVQAHCEHLGPGFRFYHLMPWPGYKAGALNFALSATAPDAEIVGVVDADYVVEPTFLADLVGHFVDPKIAFVQTPQDYRDGEDRGRYGRALYLAYLYFFKVSMAARNERNAIIYAGTMGLIRRRALAEVGGWDEWCITEDAEVSLRLLDAGYESLYVDKTYGRGLMPLDYAGLKRQRFRWAFGGMQLLRMHARRLFLPWTRGQLTAAQRFMYLSAGLQWLNDPLSLAFTAILLVGAGALILRRAFPMQPLAGQVILTPLLLIGFAVLRFLWALRVRLRCTWREAADALIVLLGLTWVVARACVRGLTSARGVFLRTPKQAPRPTFADTLRVVGWELCLGALCLVAAGVLFFGHLRELGLSHAVVVFLLVWQAFLYLSAVQTSVWSYLAHEPARGTEHPKVGLVPERSAAA
jgi:cellulose synthase/poly-beta-1,6-N-acetylglucosamine synthase-like glycosyltransferase